MQGGFFLAQNEAHTNTNSALKAHEIVQFEKIGSTIKSSSISEHTLCIGMLYVC